MAEGFSEVRVLHVDDEPEFSALCTEFLERERDSLSVTTAPSASAGLEQLATDEFDCVVSDYEMPEQNGIEFLEAVREEYPDLPFILFTGKGSEAVASDAISAGVTDYLQKSSGHSQYEVLANRILNAVEQRRASTRAAETEQRLHRLAEHTNDVLWMFSADWTELLFINSQYEDLWGLPRSGLEETPRSFLEGVHPEDRDHVRDAMQTLSGGTPVDLEYRVNPGEDYGRWVWVEGKPILADDGDVEVIVGFVRDITSQKERQRTLERERDQFTQLYTHFPEPTLTYRYEAGDPIITDINNAFEDVFGYTPDTAVGASVDELIVPPDNLEEAHALDERVHDGERVDTELRRETASGLRDFWFRNIPLANTDGPDGFAVYADITDRKQRERDLARFETVIEATGDPIYTLDADGHFTYVNDALVDLAGYPESTLLGAHASLVMAESDVAQGRALIQTLLSTEEVRGTFEMDLHTATGERVACENHIAILPFEAGFRGTVGVLRDITDRKQRERQLKHERDRLDEFADVLSHDLRSPLNVAMGHIDLARTDTDSDHLETAADALERIDELIADLLTVAREGTTGQQTDPLDLRTVATNCWQHIETPNATLSTPSTETIHAHRGRLKQLLENLFRNAIEHATHPTKPTHAPTPRETQPDSSGHSPQASDHPALDGSNLPQSPPRESGAIEDPTVDNPDRVELGDGDAAGQVTITVGTLSSGFYVEDDGPGIPEEDRTTIFESGYTTTDDGAGMGLATVKRIADAHNWDITITASTDGGARFEFTTSQEHA